MDTDKQYIDLLVDQMRAFHDRDSDAAVNKAHHEAQQLEEQLAAAQLNILNIEAPFNARLSYIKGQIDAMELIYAGQYDGSTKNVDRDLLSIQYRETKSLQVVDKAAVVGVLVANDKVVAGVASFNKKFLRSLKDVGLLDDKAAAYEIKLGTKIIPKEKIVVPATLPPAGEE